MFSPGMCGNCSQISKGTEAAVKKKSRFNSSSHAVHVTVLVYVTMLTMWWEALVMQIVCICLQASVPLLLKRQWHTTTNQPTNHYVAFPVFAVCCTCPMPTPFSLISVRPAIASQTAAAKGSETKNTVIVFHKNRGAQWEEKERGRVKGWLRDGRNGRQKNRALGRTIFKVTVATQAQGRLVE